MQIWLTRAGLVIQFVALFLLTPDIFTTERMQAATSRLRGYPTQLSATILRFNLRGVRGVKEAISFPAVLLAVGVVLLVWEPSSVLMWVGLAFTVLGGLPLALFIVSFGLFLVGELLDELSNSNHSFLVLGCVLFTAGFGILLVATFVGPP
jgi:hypothetical protein